MTIASTSNTTTQMHRSAQQSALPHVRDDATHHVDGPVASSGSRSMSADTHDKAQAATLIQKNYRGYRARRQLKGIGMDATTRWDDAIKEATWRNHTRPTSGNVKPKDPHTAARAKWKLATEVARRAGNDDLSDTSGEEGMAVEDLKAYRERKAVAREEMEKHAKMMDLPYWLEMVDSKHRYGSHLRAYHAVWKDDPTHDNFFHWLDYGEGKNISLPTVSRQRLDSEQVRYLSREERQKYLARVDAEGRLCWAHNGERIWTTIDFKDSINGIVPRNDATPLWSPKSIRGRISRTKPRPAESADSSSSETSEDDDDAEDEGQHYVNHELENTKGMKKLTKVSPATILNQLLRKTVKPGTWIFVADTSFRLFIGIKQSGAFQHSSFLHGSRLASAGLIKIKDGQIRKLSPLSGHYRPPTRNFRIFVHSLRDAGVDMSHVSISRSYAVLVGLEAYVHTRRKVKKGLANVTHHKDKVFDPETAKKREADEMDNSESARKEREFLEKQRKQEEEAKAQMDVKERLMHKLHLDDQPHSSSATLGKPPPSTDSVNSAVKSKPGAGPESHIPPVNN